jgi:hypothetical protein
MNPRVILIGTIMRNDKQKSMRLRMQGRSYNEINKLLGVPKSTLSTWFMDMKLSEKAVSRLEKRVYKKSIEKLIQRNKLQTHLAVTRARNTRTSAQRDISSLSKKELMIAGIALYWAEGYKRPIVANGKIKTSHSVSLANSDAKLIRLYLRFLREICEVREEKICAEVRIYEHYNEAYLLDFWSKATDVPNERLKAIKYGVSRSSQGKRSFNILPYGTVQIRVNDTSLYHKIMGWIEGLGNL